MIKYIKTLLNNLYYYYYLYIKASNLLNLGQLSREHSMLEKGYWKSIFRAKLSKIRLTNPFKQKDGYEVPNYYNNNCNLSIFCYVMKKILKCLRSRNSVWIFNSVGNLRISNNVLFKNSGNPDCWKTWGFGKIIVHNYQVKWKDFSSKTVIYSNFLSLNIITTKLTEIDLQAKGYIKTKKKIKGLSNILKLSKFMNNCYCKIRPNKNGFSNINDLWFQRFVKNINNKNIKIESYNLKIQSLKTKIIYEAINQLLNLIFEKIFIKIPNKLKYQFNPHIFLNEIQIHMKSVNWFIKGDLSNCYCLIKHDILIKEITKVIDDQLFIDLFFKILKNEKKIKSKNNLHIGLLKHEILDTTLLNILLHDIDLKILQLSTIFNKCSNKIKISNLKSNFVFKEMKYIRFNDCFLISMKGSKQDCIFIKNQIFLFLKLKFNLNYGIKLLTISHAKDGVYFLHHNIYIKKESFHGKNNKLFIDAPINKILKSFVLAGYCKSNNKPTCCKIMIYKSLPEIIHNYLILQWSLLNYYNKASNYKRFSRIIHYMLKTSCSLSFAAKLKLNSLKKIYKIFGKNLTVYFNKNKASEISFKKNCYVKLYKNNLNPINYIVKSNKFV